MGTLLSIARKPATRAPMEEIERAQVTQAAGLEGDVRGKLRKRQITLLSADVWAQVCGELEADLAWTTRRANLLVSGVALPQSLGARISVGDLQLEVTEETAPCQFMDAQHEGLRAALRPDWRGGVCCRVLNDAAIAVGDPVSVAQP